MGSIPIRSIPSMHPIFLLLTAGALLLPDRSRRGLALLGLVPFGLGLAAASIALFAGHDVSGLAAPPEGRRTTLFLAINTGLLVLGLVLMAGAAVSALLRERRRIQSWLASVLIVAGVFASAVEVLALPYIRWVPALGAALGIGASAITLFIIVRLLRVGRAVRWLDDRLLDRHPTGLIPALSTTFDYVWVAGFFAAAAVMCITPSLRAFSLATVVAATVSHVLMRRVGGGTAVPVSALFSLFMVPVLQYFTAIAGSANPTTAELATGSFSLAAEFRIVPWIALTAWGFSGLWPLHGAVFPLAAPLAGVILLRLGANALPQGMAHWAPLFIPLALLGLWHGAVTIHDAKAAPRRLIEMLAAVGLIGIFAGNEGITGSYWLLVAVAAVPWFSRLLYLPTLPWGFERLVWLPVAWGALLVVTGGLAIQVTYTVLAAAGIAVAIRMYHTPG